MTGWMLSAAGAELTCQSAPVLCKVPEESPDHGNGGGVGVTSGGLGDLEGEANRVQGLPPEVERARVGTRHRGRHVEQQ